jgi:hypothetical protein
MLGSALADDSFGPRAEEVRVLRESGIAASCRDAYAAPLTEEEAQMLDAAAALVGEALA